MLNSLAQKPQCVNQKMIASPEYGVKIESGGECGRNVAPPILSVSVREVEIVYL